MYVIGILGKGDKTWLKLDFYNSRRNRHIDF